MNSKTVLVTGARGALGSVVVEKFLASGCEVIAVDRGPAPSEKRSGVTWRDLDLADPKSVANGLKGLDVDTLVHCAGGFRWAHADQISDVDLDFLIDSNLKSSLLLVRELLPGMKKRGFGRIVLISSKSTLQPPAGMSAYAASKAGLNALVSSVAEEVKSFDININGVMPTIIDTPTNRKDMPGADYSTWVSREALVEIIFALTQPWGKPIHGAMIPVSGRV